MAEYPMLIIGPESKSFIVEHKDYRIFRVSSIQDVEEVIERYSGIDYLPTPLIISDISYLKSDSHAKLLKFIEESKLDLIFLASFDNTLPTILSRMKTVKKSPVFVTKSEFRSIEDGIKYLDENSKDRHENDKIHMMGEMSPYMFRYRKEFPDMDIRWLQFL